MVAVRIGVAVCVGMSVAAGVKVNVDGTAVGVEMEGS
jgi:hypothetical protein